MVTASFLIEFTTIYIKIKKILRFMICKICGEEVTDNPGGICDDCKLSMISNEDIPPYIQ